MKVLKDKEYPQDWRWAGTRISEFKFHPDFVEERLEELRMSLAKQNYEIIDYCILRSSEQSLFSTLEMLIRPIRY